MSEKKIKLLCVVGARPNYMKIAPIMRALATRAPRIEVGLVHTGQHYDVAMNQGFFDQLDIPSPDISLEVGSGTHAMQTAEIMKRFEPVLDAHQPDCVLVVGDVNSTIACALVAVKKGIRVVHVEAGLRSRDRSMPEEINRILTDQISDRLYTTEADASINLRAEGIPADRIVFAGNVMIDTLLAGRGRAVAAIETLRDGCSKDASIVSAGGFALLTLHRPANVDDPVVLARLLRVFEDISASVPIVFPVHPRTRKQIDIAGLDAFFRNPRVLDLPPLGYLEMLGLLMQARMVLTDSGGVQEETTALGIPCITLRDNTERPVTLTEGTNVLAGTAPDVIRRCVAAVLDRTTTSTRRPELWDGHAAERIVDDLQAWLAGQDRLAA